MRHNLYNRDIETFVKALLSLGWIESSPNRRMEYREFRKGRFHLHLGKRKKRSYCAVHKDIISFGHHKAITRSEELDQLFKQIIQEYKEIRD